MIGVVTTSYPRCPGDPAGAFVADRVADLRRSGEIVEVATPPPGSPLFAGRGAGAPELLEAGGQHAWLEAARVQVWLCAQVARRAAAWDAVESHWLVPSSLAVASAAPGLPHRAFAHSGDVALLERIPWGDALARALAGSGADLVFVSDDLRERFARLAGRAVGRVERLRVDRTLFRPAASAAERAEVGRRLGLSGPTALCVARLVAIKGLDVLVDAAARLRGPVTVVVLGEGPLRDALAGRALAAGVDLRMPGNVARAEVAAHMRAADVYVQPSRRLPSGRTEGLPVALLEAIASGLPCVASGTGGLSEVASAVRLVPPDSVSKLAEVLEEALVAVPAACTGPGSAARSSA